MRQEQSERYIFSAYATSLGALLHQPVKAFLSDVPCAAIPVTGGLISQSRDEVSFRVGAQEVLKAGRASATVLGELRGNHYVTLATSTVEKLNILDVVTADLVVSRVTSMYPVRKSGEKRPEGESQSSQFCLAGSHFENLRIDGKLIEYDVDPGLQSEEGFSIRKLEVAHRCLFGERREHRVAQFGTVHLGEVDMYGAKVILTMLRVELGCPFAGAFAVGGSSSNGADG